MAARKAMRDRPRVRQAVGGRDMPPFNSALRPPIVLGLPLVWIGAWLIGTGRAIVHCATRCGRLLVVAAEALAGSNLPADALGRRSARRRGPARSFIGRWAARGCCTSDFPEWAFAPAYVCMRGDAATLRLGGAAAAYPHRQ